MTSIDDARRDLWRAIKSTVPFNEDAAIYKEWRKHYQEWGSPIGPEHELDDGGVYQVFSHAIIRYTDERGTEVVVDG